MFYRFVDSFYGNQQFSDQNYARKFRIVWKFKMKVQWNASHKEYSNDFQKTIP